MNDVEKVITLWLIVYDQDPTQCYLFTSKGKVLASIEGLVRSVAPEQAADQFVNIALETIHDTFIACKFQNTQIFVHRLEIDRYNPIHRALLQCKNVLKESWASGEKRYDAVQAIDCLLTEPLSRG